jgi:hypothetical protein
MKYRQVQIFSGQRFRVPEGIQRLDHRSTHGWQLRYGSSKMFSDFSNDGSGARAALARAKAELLHRIERLPAPSRLQRQANVSKTSNLPVGISGPIVRLRKGRAYRECSFGVSIPRFGLKPTKKSVHIGTENTYTPQRYELALARAIELRNNAEQAYRSAATKSKRALARKDLRSAAR